MDTTTVLLVDDDRSVGKATMRVLVRAGFHVVLVESAASALEFVGASATGVVVSDLELGDMCGAALVDAIHRVAPGLPVIVLTGLGPEDDQLLAVAPHAHSCFQKPVDIAALCGAVGDALRERR